MVGSSATSRCSAPASLSSSDLVAGRIATGSSGSGSTHGSTTAGESLLLSVSVVSACDELGDHAEVAGDRLRLGPQRVAEG